jgi:hypothetical protein
MSEIVMTTYPTEFHRRFEQKWEHRADAAAFYESTRRMPWLLEIGRTLRAELDAVEQPVSERLAAMLKELERSLHVPEEREAETRLRIRYSFSIVPTGREAL